MTRWMISSPMRLRAGGMVVCLALLLAGCMSTQERYQKAQTLQEQGRYTEAAFALVDVLERERGYPNARRTLLTVSQQAMDRQMESARTDDRGGRHEAALDHLSTIRRLVDACAGVALEVPLPTGYAATVDAVERRAANDWIRTARSAMDAADWPAAVDAFESARQYVDAPTRLDSLDRAQAEAFLYWGEDAFADGAYRTAYGRAAEVQALVGPDHPLTADAESLRADAVSRGTKRVAFLPLWRTETAAEALPEGFLDDLNDVLATRYWTAPPPFIAATDPVSVQRALRRAGLHRRILSTRDAAAMGRALEADYVVVGEIDEAERERGDVERERVAAVLQSNGRGATSGRPDDAAAGADTSYTVERYDLMLSVDVTYRVIDVSRRHRTGHGSADAAATGPMAEASFAGDWRELDLNGSERDLFAPAERRRALQPIATEAADRLAAELAEDAFQDVLREID